MQTELEASHPELEIQILGVNEWGHDGANGNANLRATTGRDLPYLQDVDADGDGQSDVWSSWEVTWRDVIVVDANSEITAIYNLTPNNLADPDKFDELKQLVIDAATPDAVSGDCNADGTVMRPTWHASTTAHSGT